MAAPLHPGPLCYSLFPLHFSSQTLSFMMRGLVYTHVGTPICSCIYIPHPIPPLPKPLLLDHAWNTSVCMLSMVCLRKTDLGDWSREFGGPMYIMCSLQRGQTLGPLNSSFDGKGLGQRKAKTGPFKE